jgi:chromosome segregation ATPase
VFGLTATSSALPSVQINLYQSRLQQARLEAAQAEDNVRYLEAQTNDARQQADEAENNVNSLEGQAPRVQPTVNTQGQITGSLLSVQA